MIQVHCFTARMFNNTSQCHELEVRSERPLPASAHSRILILAPSQDANNKRAAFRLQAER
jgi:hypothetical protein